LQPRFEQRSGQRPYRAAASIRAFAPAGIFLDLRCRSGELEGELADLASWWDASRSGRRRTRGDAASRTPAPSGRGAAAAAAASARPPPRAAPESEPPAGEA
jgi:hypothetical protein